MKRYILSALTVVLASAAVAPVAQAFEPETSLQERRIEVLDSRSKNSVQKLRVEHLENQTNKNLIQKLRVQHLESQTNKSQIQKLRVQHLENQTKTSIR